MCKDSPGPFLMAYCCGYGGVTYWFDRLCFQFNVERAVCLAELRFECLASMFWQLCPAVSSYFGGTCGLVT